MFNYILYGRLGSGLETTCGLGSLYFSSAHYPTMLMRAVCVHKPFCFFLFFFLARLSTFLGKGLCVCVLPGSVVSHAGLNSFLFDVFFFFPFSFLNKLVLFISLTFVQFAVHLTRHLVGAYGNLVMYCILFILFFCVLCAYCILYYCPVPVPILFTMCVCHVALHPSIHLGAEGE